MKNLQFVFAFSLLLLGTSCQDDEISEALTVPSCIEDKIQEVQESSVDDACLATVSRYTFEGAFVFEIRDRNTCFNGLISIINEDCEIVCGFGGFNPSTACGSSIDFYADAVLEEVIWEEQE